MGWHYHYTTFWWLGISSSLRWVWSSPLGYLISSLSFVHNYLANHDQQQPSNNQPINNPSRLLEALACIYSLRSPLNSNCHSIQETICHWQNLPLLRQILVNCSGQSEAATQSYTCDQNEAHSHNISVFFKETKSSKVVTTGNNNKN